MANVDYNRVNKLAGEVVEQDYHRQHSEPDYVDELTEGALRSLSSEEQQLLEQCKSNWEINSESENSTDVLADELIGRMNAND